MELDRLIGIISEVLPAEPGSITAQTLFVEELGANSMDMFQIAMAVEEKYDIEIDMEALERVRTVQDAADLVREKTRHQRQ